MNELRSYTVVQGDTIHQIARRHLGDASRWVVIAVYNRLDYPYVCTTGEAYPGNVAGVGSTLLLPLSESARLVERGFVQAAVSQDDFYALLLGVDLALDATGDLTDNGAGDLGSLAGVPNLKDALQHRLDTRFGELVYHPTYGTRLEEHIGRPRDFIRGRLIGLEIKRTLLADPRIADVLDVTVDDHTSETFQVAARVRVIGRNDETTLNVVLNRRAL